MKRLSNERGQLTVDFLFGCTLILGTAAILGALTFALTLAEVLQYISYAGARTYFAADLNAEEQKKIAEEKLGVLLNPKTAFPFLQGALVNGWITVVGQAEVKPDFPEYQVGRGDNGKRSQYTGVRISFKVPIINLNLPFIRQPVDFETPIRVTSFLMREPTLEESRKFLTDAYPALLKTDGRYQAAASRSVESKFQPILENGG